MYPVLEHAESGSSAFDLSKPLTKSASTCTSNPLLPSSSHARPSSREQSKCLTIRMTAVSFYVFDSLKNLAARCTAIDALGLVHPAKQDKEPTIDLQWKLSSFLSFPSVFLFNNVFTTGVAL